MSWIMAGNPGAVRCATERVWVESYRASERDFRTAFTDFQARTNSVVRRVFRPFLVKWILEVAAVLHRRRGAWA